jgi:carboxymethylenebutenolidase
MLDYLHEFEGVSEPVCILWGDRDHRAPEDVLNAYRALASKKSNVELHIFPGVQHGYMMQGMPKAYDARAREFSMTRAVAILDGFRSSNVRKAIREAS